jgi:hypothetical protein
MGPIKVIKSKMPREIPARHTGNASDGQWLGTKYRKYESSHK